MALLLASATADAIQSRLPRPSVAAPAALGINALAGSRQKADLPVGRWRPASPLVGGFGYDAAMALSDVSNCRCFAICV